MTSGELVELNREIEAKRRSCRRHGIWALLGVSPAALLPILGLAVDFGGGVALAACVFVSGLESWRAVQAHADLKEAQEAKPVVPRARGPSIERTTWVPRWDPASSRHREVP